MASTGQEQQASDGRSFLPPECFTLDTILMSELWYRMEHEGYLENKAKSQIHIAVFRCCLQRLLDATHSSLKFDVDTFLKDKNTLLITSEDVRVAVHLGQLPAIELAAVERWSLVFEDMNSCVLARIWGVICYLMIMANIILIVVQSLPEICDRSSSSHCYHVVEVVCILFFTFDYVARVACAPFCRVALVDREFLLGAVVLSAGKASASITNALSFFQRFVRYVTQTMNLIDFLSILPFWLNLTVGDIIPMPLTFLRALRLLRLFRVMKLGRFGGTFNVLGTTLAQSLQSIYVLFLWVCVSSLIFGAIMNQIEPDVPAFQTVPHATWYVWSRMTSFQSSAPFAPGKATTLLGGILFAILSFFKAILWILPFGMIGAVFTKEWRAYNEQLLLRTNVALRDLVKPGTEWIESLRGAVVRIEILSDGSDATVQAVGYLPIPVLEEKWGAAQSEVVEVQVNLLSAELRPWFGSEEPTITCEVQWHPKHGSKPAQGQPIGTLSLRPVQASGFYSRSQKTWRCRFCLPSMSNDQSSENVWVSGPSSGETPSPSWAEPLKQFHIDWLVPDVSPHSPVIRSMPTMVSLNSMTSSHGLQSPLHNAFDVSSEVHRLEETLEASSNHLRHQADLLATFERTLASKK